MIGVKRYLDQKFGEDKNSSASKKENGHHEVHGTWGKVLSTLPKGEQFNGDLSKIYRIEFHVNNETITIKIIAGENKLKNNHYYYLQTYEHIPRGKPDKNGYYARSTDEEIIKYINTLYEEFLEVYEKNKQCLQR